MEVGGIGWQWIVVQAVVDLIEERADCVHMLILERYPRVPSERHREEHVEPAVGHHGHRFGVDEACAAESAAEEIAERALHARLAFVIPVEPQHQITQHETVGVRGLFVDGDPDMTDAAGAVDVGQCDRFATGNVAQAGAALARRAQFAGGDAAAAGLPGRILRVDRTAGLTS